MRFFLYQEHGSYSLFIPLEWYEMNVTHKGETTSYAAPWYNNFHAQELA